MENLIFEGNPQKQRDESGPSIGNEDKTQLEEPYVENLPLNRAMTGEEREELPPEKASESHNLEQISQEKEVIELKPGADSLSLEEIKANIRNTMKDVLISNEVKRLTLVTMTKLIKDGLKLCMKIDNFDLFNDFFFDKYLLMCNKKIPEVVIECIKIAQHLFIEKKILDTVEKLKYPQKKFIDIINFVALYMEIFSSTHFYLSLSEVLFFILDYVSGKDYMKEELAFLKTLKEEMNKKYVFSPQNRNLLNKIQSSLNRSDAKKKEFLTFCSFLLGNSGSIYHQLEIFSSILSEGIRSLIGVYSISNYNEKDVHKTQLLNEVLDILERIFFQTEYFITIDQNFIQETKLYVLNHERKILKEHPKLYLIFAHIVNECLLMPYETTLQNRVLILIRRLYFLYPLLRKHIIRPLNLVLSNISVFGSDPAQLKDATIFLYQLLHTDNSDPELKERLESNENLKFLKENKYYSVKSLSYPQEIDFIHNVRSLNLDIGYFIKAVIDAETFLALNLFVSNENSLLYWKFTTVDYDIAFGIYKMNVIEDVPVKALDGYCKSGKAECLLKIQRCDSNSRLITGSILIQLPGLYRIIFDNTYSFWRPKTLNYNIHLLEKKKINDE